MSEVLQSSNQAAKASQALAKSVAEAIAPALQHQKKVAQEWATYRVLDVSTLCQQPCLRLPALVADTLTTEVEVASAGDLVNLGQDDIKSIFDCIQEAHPNVKKLMLIGAQSRLRTFCDTFRGRQ